MCHWARMCLSVCASECCLFICLLASSWRRIFFPPHVQLVNTNNCPWPQSHVDLLFFFLVVFFLSYSKNSQLLVKPRLFLSSFMIDYLMCFGSKAGDLISQSFLSLQAFAPVENYRALHSQALASHAAQCRTCHSFIARFKLKKKERK